MSQTKQFEKEREKNIEQLGRNKELQDLGRDFLIKSSRHNYSYNFDWLGRPIIQYPQDIVAFQEIVWRVQPDLIIETGIARGGSLILSASLMELIGGSGRVVGIDIDIRDENEAAIKKHPLYKRISMIEGSSTAPEVIAQVKKFVQESEKVLVCLDSNHAHDHVLKELEIYAPFVSKGSYLIVFDTVIDDMPQDSMLERPWGKGNSPKSAVQSFLKVNDDFVVDKIIEDKLVITVAPSGYLLRVK